MSSWIGNPGRPPYVIPRGSAGLKKEKSHLSILSKKNSDGEDYTEPTVIPAAGELYAMVTDIEDDGIFDIVAHSSQIVYVLKASDVTEVANTSPASGSTIIDMAVADRFVFCSYVITMINC